MYSEVFIYDVAMNNVAKFLLTICLKGHNYVLCVTDGWCGDATLDLLSQLHHIISHTASP